MCTVTFIARNNGFALGMNRDEKLTRVKACPPAFKKTGIGRALFPFEPGGGTWIGVNDVGACFALINWYSVPRQVSGQAMSRGNVVKSSLAADSMDEADKILQTLPLDRVNPFRLIGVFPASRAIIEWRWNLEKLKPFRHRWKPLTWISSGFDETGAQRSRGKSFTDALRQKSSGSLPWLRRLHRSHKPTGSAYSTCMHRADAATVSYTEVVVSSSKAAMRYHADTPCQSSKKFIHTFELQKKKSGSASVIG